MTFDDFWVSATSGYKILGGTRWELEDLKHLALQSWRQAQTNAQQTQNAIKTASCLTFNANQSGAHETGDERRLKAAVVQ